MNAYEELIDRIKKIPISRLGDVVAAMEGRLESRGFTKQQLDEAGRVAASLPNAAAAVLESSEGDKLAAMEREVCKLALSRSGGNVSAAARLVGMDRKSFDRLARKLGARR
jgi:DNA-binding NtrC family response regulator